MKRTDQWYLTTATNPLTGWSQMDNNTKHKKTKCDYKSTQCLPSSGLEAGGLDGEGGGGGRKGQDTNCQLSWTDLTWPNIQRGSVNCFESTYIAHSINCQQPQTFNYIYMFTPYPHPKSIKNAQKSTHTQIFLNSKTGVEVLSLLAQLDTSNYTKWRQKHWVQ